MAEGFDTGVSSDLFIQEYAGRFKSPSNIACNYSSKIVVLPTHQLTIAMMGRGRGRIYVG